MTTATSHSSESEVKVASAIQFTGGGGEQQTLIRLNNGQSILVGYGMVGIYSSDEEAFIGEDGQCVEIGKSEKPVSTQGSHPQIRYTYHQMSLIFFLQRGIPRWETKFWEFLESCNELQLFNLSMTFPDFALTYKEYLDGKLILPFDLS